MPKLGKVEQVFVQALKENVLPGELSRDLERLSLPEWESLYKLAEQNRMAPLFYRRLSVLPIEITPQAIFRLFKDAYFHNLKRNMILERRILQVISLLKSENISSIPLKGPVFARLLYDDIALRQASCDLDLLVPQHLVKKAEEQLRGIGYTFYHEYLKAEFFYSHRKQINLLRLKEKLNGLTLDLDLHWDFRTGFVNTDIDDFWRNAREVNLNANSLLIPSDEDMLLFLAMTAITDWDFAQTKYLYDIHRFITKFGSALDWQKLALKAKKLHLDAALFYSLKLCRNLFDTTVLQENLTLLQPHPFKKTLLKGWLKEVNVIKYRNNIASLHIWWVFLGNYLYAGNIFAALKIIVRRIFVPSEQVAQLYQQGENGKSRNLYLKRLFRHFRYLATVIGNNE